MKLHARDRSRPNYSLCGRTNVQFAAPNFSWEDPEVCAACDRVSQAPDMRAERAERQKWVKGVRALAGKGAE